MSIIASKSKSCPNSGDSSVARKFKKSTHAIYKRRNISTSSKPRCRVSAYDSTKTYPGVTFKHMIQIEMCKQSMKHLFIEYGHEHKCDIDCKLPLTDSNLFFCYKTWMVHKEPEMAILKKRPRTRVLLQLQPILTSQLVAILRENNILFNQSEIWRYTKFLIDFVREGLGTENLNEYSGHALCVFLIFTHDCFKSNSEPFDRLIVLLKKICNERNLCNVSSLILENKKFRTKKKMIVVKTKKIVSQLMINDPTWFMGFEPFKFKLSSFDIG